MHAYAIKDYNIYYNKNVNAYLANDSARDVCLIVANI